MWHNLVEKDRFHSHRELVLGFHETDVKADGIYEDWMFI